MPSSHSLEKSRRQVELVIRGQTRWSGKAPHPPYPPPPQKKNSGHYSCDTTKIYLKCSRSIQPFCRCAYRAANKERGAGTRDFPWPLKAWPLSTYSQLFNFPSANCIYIPGNLKSQQQPWIYIYFLPLSLTNLFDFATKAKAMNKCMIR